MKIKNKHEGRQVRHRDGTIGEIYDVWKSENSVGVIYGYTGYGDGEDIDVTLRGIAKCGNPAYDVVEIL
jgi:hypothetical protein